MRLYRLACFFATLISISTLHAATAETLQTVVATESVLPHVLRFNGEVEAINQGTLTAQTAGEVEAILVDVDDQVEKGNLLIRLKDSQQKADLARANANLHESKALLSTATEEFQRSKDLHARKLLPKAKLEQAEAALESAKARLDAARAGLTQAREQLGYTRILAPYSGIVTQRHIEVGEIAHTGQKLMSGLSLTQLRVNVDIPQSLIPTIRQLTSATILLPDNRSVTASGLTVFPFADSASNSIKVRLQLPEDTAGLIPGMFVKAAFQVGETRRLMVPVSALVYRSELTALYIVADDGRISLRRVRTGELIGEQISILSGLSSGERVAIDPIAAGIKLKQQAGHE